MYLEHFDIPHSPFAEQPDYDVFYPGGQRENIYQQVLNDIVTGKPLVKLTGEEGSGKTHICRILVDLLPANYEVIYIDNPVGSFDSLLRIICYDLGMDPHHVQEERNLQEEFRDIITDLGKQERKVVLIIDEAEKLYLATVERLARTICETAGGDVLRIVLAGREGLDDNLEQLSMYCTNVNFDRSYELHSLTLEETGAYLTYRLEKAGIDLTAHPEIFTPGAVKKIHAASQGNCRLINILAEEALQNSGQEKSFMVLLDHVTSSSGISSTSEESTSRRRRFSLALVFKFIRQRSMLMTGLAALMLVAMLFLFSGPEEATIPNIQDADSSSSIVSLLNKGEKPIISPVLQPSPALPLTEERLTDTVPVSEHESPSLEFLQAAARPEQPTSPPPRQTERAEETVSPPPAVSLSPIVSMSSLKESDIAGLENNAAPSLTESGKRVARSGEPMMIVPRSIKIKKGETPSASLAESTIKPLGRKIWKTEHAQTGADAENNPVLPAQEATAPPAVDMSHFLAERERASAETGWVTGAYQGKYTIQLMKLESQSAEENLIRMLERKDHQGVRKEFYILRKRTRPPVLFVFYGSYDSVDAARKGRQRLPAFLQESRPFVLSVKDALRKTDA